MKLKYPLLYTSIFLLLPIFLFAQNRPYRQFSTQEVQQKLRVEHPEMLATQLQIERNLINNYHPSFREEVTIPIVFHVLYKNLEELIPPTQILEQIDLLNQVFDFGAADIQHPADTLEGFVNLQAQSPVINFCLGLGDPSTGSGASAIDLIQYVPTLVDEWTIDDAIKQSNLGGVAPLNPEKYLNIWVGDLDEIAGYAAMRGTLAELDGIVIDYKYLGNHSQNSPYYNGGKTLVHLIGSYLGLYELSGSYPCADDYVFDTPVHNAPNYGCPSYKHVSTCFGYGVEMTMNYMDYTDDDCMYMFTQGQLRRMSKMLQEARSGLIENTTILCEWDASLQAEVEERAADKKLEQAAMAVNIFPNPAKDELNVVWQDPSAEPSHLLIYDATGKMVYHRQQQGTQQQQVQINTTNWLAGIYFLQVQTNTENRVFRVAIAPKY